VSDKLRELTPDEIKRLAAWFRREMDADIFMYRPEFLARRFLPRAAAMGFRDICGYLDFADRDSTEKKAARKRLLVPTTEFFRNREVFGTFLDVLRKSPEAGGWKELVIVSAPCSTGEEALSLAILCEEAGISAKIVALDRSLSSLRQGASARYSKKALSKLDKSEIKRYFKEDGLHRPPQAGGLKTIQPVCCDLKAGLPVKAAHAVFMRNFFIYLSDEAQERMIENVKKILVDGGFLVLGKVERLRPSSGEWKAVNLESKIYALKRGKR